MISKSENVPLKSKQVVIEYECEMSVCVTKRKRSRLTTCGQITETDVNIRCKQSEKLLDRVQNHMYCWELKHLRQVSDTRICVLDSLAS